MTYVGVGTKYISLNLLARFKIISLFSKSPTFFWENGNVGAIWTANCVLCRAARVAYRILIYPANFQIITRALPWHEIICHGAFEGRTPGHFIHKKFRIIKISYSHITFRRDIFMYGDTSCYLARCVRWYTCRHYSRPARACIWQLSHRRMLKMPLFSLPPPFRHLQDRLDTETLFLNNPLTAVYCYTDILKCSHLYRWEKVVLLSL